jgi:hypothetical protein
LHLYLLATVGRNWRSLAGVAVLAAPTTLVMIVSGQNGFLTAALLVGGLQNLDRRPTLSGVFFGLLTYKPQFFLLIPVVLLARRSVRAILSGCATFLTTFLLSGAFFGFALWTQWLSKIFPYSDLLNTHFELERLMPTILAGCHVTAVPKTISVAIYLATAVAFGFITWKANREHKTSEVMSITIVCVFLTAPYAFIYDTPMITSALFYEYQRRKSMARPFTMWEVELALVNLVLVFGMISTTLPFALFLGLCTLLWAVIRVRPNAPRPEIVVAG